MYKLIDLKYDSLQPFLSEKTITIHHTKHHQKYLNNLNSLLERNNYDYRYSLEELVFHIDIFPLIDRDDILFNLGGVLNHNLYFETIGNEFHKPEFEILKKIEEQYGTYEKFKDKFIDKASKLKGSGYTFLVLNNDKLDIINLSNQDTPYSYNMFPILNIDLWEHAYYLDYQNLRDEYIKNFFQSLNFNKINENYQNAKTLQQDLQYK